jgi:hypothetical protein
MHTLKLFYRRHKYADVLYVDEVVLHSRSSKCP